MLDTMSGEGRSTTNNGTRLDQSVADHLLPSTLQPSRSTSPGSSTSGPTAVIKGAGPSGLAAALSLIEAGFEPPRILVIEKRKFRPEGQGRKNMVAIRPEGLRRLDEFGCLKYARDKGWITDLKTGRTFNEWNIDLEGGGVFEWPITRYDIGRKVEKASNKVVDNAKDEDGKRKDSTSTIQPENSNGDILTIHADHERDEALSLDEPCYIKPATITEQVPCCFIDLGHLEDALLYVARKKKLQVRWDASLRLSREENGKLADDNETRFKAVLTGSIDGHESDEKRRIELGTPDLIICASGKNDHTLEEELGFRRYIGLKLEGENAPVQGKRALKLGGGEHEMESQLFSVFGVRTPAREMGLISHVVRKEGTGDPEQPVTEIQMMHAGSTHCLIQLPRGMNLKDLDKHITRRVNANLKTDFVDVEDMERKGALLWGEPLTPVVVETSTAPQYVFGSNVVLIGDAAMSCSPSSGLGADIGMTVDSRNVAELAAGLLKTLQESSKTSNDEEQDDDNRTEDEVIKKEKMVQKTTTAVIDSKLDLLLAFNQRKTEASISWSQGSRWFYITRAEADEILASRMEKLNGRDSRSST